LLTVVSLTELDVQTSEQEISLHCGGSEKFRASLFPKNVEKATRPKNR